MTDKRKEELSALMDGEASELELRRLLKSMEQDSELSDTWERYHMIRSGLQGHTQLPLDLDISDRVARALESEQPLFDEDTFTPDLETDPAAEPSVQAVSPKKVSPTWLKQAWQPLTQTAVAASVALVAVFGWQNLQNGASVATGGGSELASAPSVQASPGLSGLGQSSFASNGFSQADFGFFAGQRAGASPVSLGPMGPVATQPDFENMELVKSGTIANKEQQPTQISRDYKQVLDAYFVTHTGNAAINAPQGMMPFARVVDIDVEQKQQ